MSEKLSAAQQHRLNMLESFRKYVDIVSEQQEMKDLSEDAFLDEMLYGLGVAIDREEYSQTAGYNRFLDTLYRFIESKLSVKE